MVTADEAQALAQACIEQIPSNFEIILLAEHVVETDDAWYFPYNGREYVETGNFSAALAGNHPVRVDKVTGTARLESPPLWKTT